MSNSKVKSNPSPQQLSNQTPTNTNNCIPQVHIFPTNAFNPRIIQLLNQINSKKINCSVYQKFSDFHAIVKKVEQTNKRQICLIQLKEEQGGCDTCFPKNYIFPNSMNIFIVFFSFRHIKSSRSYFLATQQIAAFCEKELRPQKIKLKTVQNLKTDKSGKNSSSGSTDKHKPALASHQLISQSHSQQYQLLFYLVNEEAKFHLNQNQFNYQYLLKSVEKIQKCYSFAGFEELLRKQLYRQEKKYIILSNLSDKLEKILRQINSEQLFCFDILIFGDMKPVNLFLDRHIVMATSDYQLIFKFLKNHGFDSPELRQEQRRTSQRYSISSNDFRLKMDNLMNVTSSDYTNTNNSNFLSQVAEKRIRQWMVDKENQESTKFITFEIKTQQFQSSVSGFKPDRSVDRSQFQSLELSKLKNTNQLAKNHSNLQARYSGRQSLQLESKIQHRSEVKQKSIIQIKRESKVKNSQNAQLTDQEPEGNETQSTYHLPTFGQNTIQNINQNNYALNGLCKNRALNEKQRSVTKQSKFNQYENLPNHRILRSSTKERNPLVNSPLIIKKQQHVRLPSCQLSDYQISEVPKQPLRPTQAHIQNPKQLSSQYYTKQILKVRRLSSASLKKSIKSRSLAKASLISTPKKIYKPLVINKNLNVLGKLDEKNQQSALEISSQASKLVKNIDRFAQRRAKRSSFRKSSVGQLSSSFNTSQFTQKSKNRVSIVAKKSQQSVLIFGEEPLQQAKSRLLHIQPKINQFQFIIHQQLNYLNKMISESIAFPKDNIRNYQSVQGLYQILRVEDQYDLGFIFCLKNNLNLINLKLLPSSYFIVIIQSQNESYLEISEQSKTIKLTALKHFRLAQQIILESRMLQYVIYHKSNKQAAFLVKNFANSEFILEKTQSHFNEDLIENYCCDDSRLTRLYFVCEIGQLSHLLKSLKQYSKESHSFNSQICNIICIAEKEMCKSFQMSQSFQVTFVDRLKRFIDNQEVLKQVFGKRKIQQIEIQQELFFYPRSISLYKQLHTKYPGRFQCYQYERMEEIENFAAQMKKNEGNKRTYLVLNENYVSKPIFQLFYKIFLISKTKLVDKFVTKVFNVEELLELLRF